MSLLQDFKQFVMRGNVIDMAVGVIIGAAFGKIVSALVDKVMMPIIGQCTSGVDFAHLYIPLDRAKYLEKGGEALTIADAEKAGIPVVAYGEFINSLINFLIVALCVFVMIKIIAAFQRKREEAPTTTGPTKEQELLTDIRDLLKQGR